MSCVITTYVWACMVSKGNKERTEGREIERERERDHNYLHKMKFLKFLFYLVTFMHTKSGHVGSDVKLVLHVLLTLNWV